MNRNYDSAIKEAVFIALPIAVLFIIKAIGGDLIIPSLKCLTFHLQAQ